MSGNKAVRFRQSAGDFPMVVSLGEKRPDWGLTRWGGQGLRFVSPDDEGFTLRGDRRRLVYKGRRRSHRFTILGDTAFEYDCILNREPESNVISLVMEGAEKYDFFRQPDFVPDPFLKGSYAVYKKETLIGEGTGKLCHIHRPEIIDARGRRCWGKLAVIGNELRITIPEQWLAEARYPVIVDPTIGTITVGSFAYIQYSGDTGSSLVYEIGVNRFLAPEKITGQCTAWAYFSYINTNNHSYNPRIFDDDNNKPTTRRSCNEGNAWWGRWLNDNYIVQPTESTPKWKSATFDIIGTINQGTYFWFGGYGDVYYPRFDYGAIMYKAYKEYIYEDEDDEEGIEYPDFPYFGYEKTYDRKFSWYFEFISQSQNYVRTLTQGVTLIDSRKVTADYKRSVIQLVKGAAVLNAPVSFFRQCLMTVANSISLARLPVFIRSVIEQAEIKDRQENSRCLNRKCKETATVIDDTKRIQGFFRNLADSLSGTDCASFPVLFVRTITETQGITDTFRQWGAFIRGLMDLSGSEAETTHQAEYYRIQNDTVQADGAVFRGLTLFIRIVTQVLVRDYLLHRFLKAREEIVLKSPVCREIILESKIN